MTIVALGAHVECHANPAQALLDEIDRIYTPCASSGNSLLGRGPDNYVADLIDGAHVCLVSLVVSSDVPDTRTILPVVEPVN
jgi:hypothetical protein